MITVTILEKAKNPIEISLKRNSTLRDLVVAVNEHFRNTRGRLYRPHVEGKNLESYLGPAQLDQPLTNWAAGELLIFEIKSLDNGVNLELYSENLSNAVGAIDFTSRLPLDVRRDISGFFPPRELAQQQGTSRRYFRELEISFLAGRNEELDVEISTKINQRLDLTAQQRQSLMICLVGCRHPVAPQSFWQMRGKILAGRLGVEDAIQKIIGVLNVVPKLWEMRGKILAGLSVGEAIQESIVLLNSFLSLQPSPDQLMIAITAPLGPQGETLLTVAASMGWVQIVGRLLNLLPPEQQVTAITTPFGGVGATLLTVAACSGQFRIVESLLRRLPSEQQVTAITTPFGGVGATLLTVADSLVELVMVESLLRRLPSEQQVTAITTPFGVVGAKQGETLLTLAASSGRVRVESLLRRLPSEQKVTAIMTPLGAHKGETLLAFAAFTGYWEVVVCLLDLLPSEQQVTAIMTPLGANKGKTFLTVAASSGRVDMVESLLRRLPSEQQVTAIMTPLGANKGETLLTVAAFKGRWEVVRYLLELLTIDQKMIAIMSLLGNEKLGEEQVKTLLTKNIFLLLLLPDEEYKRAITTTLGSESLRGKTLLSFLLAGNNVSHDEKKYFTTFAMCRSSLANLIEKEFNAKNYLACYALLVEHPGVLEDRFQKITTVVDEHSLFTWSDFYKHFHREKANINILQHNLDSGQSLGSLIGSKLSELLTEIDNFNLKYFQSPGTTGGKINQIKDGYCETVIALIQSSGLSVGEQITLAMQCAESITIKYQPRSLFSFSLLGASKSNPWQEKVLGIRFVCKGKDEEKQVNFTPSARH
jgi:ankyrin repeat protein